MYSERGITTCDGCFGADTYGKKLGRYRSLTHMASAFPAKGSSVSSVGSDRETGSLTMKWSKKTDATTEILSTAPFLLRPTLPELLRTGRAHLFLPVPRAKALFCGYSRSVAWRRRFPIHLFFCAFLWLWRTYHRKSILGATGRGKPRPN